MYDNSAICTLMFCHFIQKIPINELIKYTNAHIATLYRWKNKLKGFNWDNVDNMQLDIQKIIRIKRTRYLKKSTQNVKKYIDSYMTNNKFIKINQIIKDIKDKYNITLKKSTIYNIIKKLKYTLKKVRINKILIKDIDEHLQKVKDFKGVINKKIEQGTEFWSLDESAFYINMINEYGWSKKGKQCIHDRETRERKRYSLELLISNKSIISHKIYEGSVYANQLNQFLNDQKINENTRIILDNARIHTAGVIKKANYYDNLIYNVPYSPETNPIEMVFSKIKSYVKKEDNSTQQKLFNNIEAGIKTITSRDLQNYFKKSFC